MSCDPVLDLLNTEMGDQGSLQTDCDLLFFTPALCYKVKICCNAGLSLFVYDRLKPDFGWRVVANGTLNQIVSTLNADGPFLSEIDVPTFWTTTPN